MKKEVWLRRSPEWIKENPGKGTLYKSIIDDKTSVVPLTGTKEVRDYVKRKGVKKTQGIYLIKCESSKSVYVGQSTNMDSRLRQHKYIMKTKSTKIISYKKIFEDMSFFGIDAFEFIKFIIMDSPSGEDLLKQETQTMWDFINSGYSLYNTVVGMNNEVVYCPLRFQDEVKKFISDLMSKEN